MQVTKFSLVTDLQIMLSNVTHSNFKFECNKERGSIDQLYIELGLEPVWYAGILVIFGNSFNFSWILAAKQVMVVILRSFWFFWHPWHPWGRLSSGDIWVLRFVLNILLQRCHLAEIFIFIKMISHVHFIILVHQTVILSLLILTKLTVNKIHHLIRLKFERSELKKSQCVYNLPDNS